MQNPEIISCEAGVVTWTARGVEAYRLTVDGKPVSDSPDGLYRKNYYDASAFTKDVRIAVASAVDGNKSNDSSVTAVLYKAETRRLTVLPVTGFKLDNEILSWDPAGTGMRYRLIDTEYNVTKTTHTSFDMTKRNLLIGVYPDYGSDIIDCEILDACDIPYLAGSGSESEPYEIKKAFDLRAIDYYEMLDVLNGSAKRNVYKIMNDINYEDVGALDNDSNIFMLKKPFYGKLDGNGKTLSNISVIYDGGYWALFDFICSGATVGNMVFESPTVVNRLQTAGTHPLNASIATVADRNYGTVEKITLCGARYETSGGEICGIVSHNHGTVRDCSVSGLFVQGSTGLVSQACYEMAGVVLENCNGGRVENNFVANLVVRGTECEGAYGVKYNNVRTVGGITAVNRSGGLVAHNGYKTLTLVNMLGNYNGFDGGFEWGGIAAYNAGTVICAATDRIGIMTFNGSAVTEPIGADGEPSDDQRGTVIGKNDGAVSFDGGAGVRLKPCERNHTAMTKR